MRPVNDHADPSARYRALLDVLDIGVALIDRTRGVRMVNTAAARLLGRAARDLEGRTPLEPRWTPRRGDGTPFATDELPANVAMRTGEPQVGVTMCGRFDDGRLRWFSTSAYPLFEDGADAPSGVVVSFQDVTEQRTNERALRESETRFRLLFETGGEAMMIVDPTTQRILEVNDAAVELYGYSREEFGELLIPQTSAQPEQTSTALEEVVTAGQLTVPLRLHRKKDGTVFPVEISAGSFEVDGHQVASAILRDIGPRIDAEHAVRRERDHSAGLLRALQDGLIEVDLHGTITEVNEQFCDMVGWSRGDLLGTSPPYPFWPPELYEQYSDAYFAHNRDHVIEWERVYQHRRGGRFPVMVSRAPVVDDGGRVVSRLAIVRDYTGRRETEARFRLLAEHATDLIACHDADLICTYVSPACRALLGYEPEELIGQHGLALWHPEDAAVILERTRDLRDDPVPVEHRMRHRSGAYRWFETVARTARDESGSVVELQSASRNVDQRRATEEALRESELAKQRLEARHQTDRLEVQLAHARRAEGLGRIAQGIAHDFNNLLAVIQNQAAFVARHLEAGDPLAADVDHIRRSVDQGSQLTRQLLSFSRAGSLSPEVFDLRAIADGVCRLLRRPFGERIRLTLTPTPGPCAVEIDRGQAEQILMNLLINARDAIRDRGVVTVTVELAAVEEIGTSGTHAGPFVELTVTDDGVGMAPEVRDQALEPYFSTKDDQGGSGLGLATVSSILAAVGGQISIESEPGIGTTVRVRLPAAEPKAGADRDPKPEPAHRDEAPAVLVVDDDDELRRDAARVLSEAGYRVREAADGEAALVEIDRRAPSVLLTDIMMPGMSGEELALRATRRCPALPVVFMSGHAPALDARGLAEAIVEKPFTSDQLLQSVGNALARPEPTEAPEL